jgi:hypothetical protein
MVPQILPAKMKSVQIAGEAHDHLRLTKGKTRLPDAPAAANIRMRYD